MSLLRPAIAAILAALLLAIYAWDKRASELAFIETAAEDRLLVFDATQVRAIRIEGPAGAFAFVRTDRGWNMTEPRAMRADTTQVDALLGNIKGAKKTRPFVPSDVSAYGLDAPKSMVEIELAAGGASKKWKLELGGSGGQSGRIYARIAGTDEVFSVGDWVFRQTERSLDEWRNRNISEGLPAGAASFTIDSARGSVTISRADNRWRFEGDGLSAPADTVMVEGALKALANGRLAQVIDAPTSTTAELGFDRPACVVRSGDAVLLTVGRKLNAKGDFSIKLEGGSVGVATTATLREFLRAPLEWSTKRFLWHDAAEAASISIESGSSSVEILWKDQRWRFADGDDVPVNQRRAIELWNDLVKLAAVQFVEGPKPPEERRKDLGFSRPSLKLRVKFADGVEQGFDAGSTSVQEGQTFLRRVQDDTVWGIDFAMTNRFFKFHSDLEERRIFPSVATKTARFEIRQGGKAFVFDKLGANWRVTLTDGRTAMSPAADVEAFLLGIEDLEWDSVIMGEQEKEPAATMLFFAEGEKDAFCHLSLIDTINGDDGSPRAVIVSTSSGNYTVKLEEYRGFDVPLERLVKGIAISLEQGAKK